MQEMLKDPGYAYALATVLRVLNRLLEYEMATVLEPWYGAPAAYPREAIKEARKFFCEDSTVTLRKIGVTLPPDRPD